MGKRKLEKIKRIESSMHRKVTQCKRKKGLLKKSIELSVLCDLKMFLFIYDTSQNRVVHYASNPDDDFFALFNEKRHREFFTNQDYIKVGGRREEFDELEDDSEPSEHDQILESGKSQGDELKRAHSKSSFKFFSVKREEGLVTSQIGSLIS